MFESESDRPLVGKARNDEFPWAVIITTDSNDASCTGFLLNDRMVLTRYFRRKLQLVLLPFILSFHKNIYI